MILDEDTQKLLRSKYNPDGSKLREMQLKMKEILDVVDDICLKYGIRYWLSSGTLIGAVRHGGFIPWDDDIDIDMLYEDIPKFLAACEKELPERYIIQTHQTDKKYFQSLIKIRELDSNITEKMKIGKNSEYMANYTYNGLFIDILPIESSHISLVKFSGKLMAFLMIALYKWRLPFWMLETLYNINKFIFGFLRMLAVILIKPNERYVTYGGWFIGKRDLNDILPTSRINFEGSQYNAPKDSDKYLTRIYGDYTQLPDEISRKPLHDTSLL